VIDIAALDVMPTKASGGGDMWVSASSVNAEVATSDVIALEASEIRVDGDGVQVTPLKL
jgi:hypothetical protein